MVIEPCKANCGAGVYIYSPSEYNPVKIDSYNFNNNKLLSSGNVKLNSGSAVYIVAKNCEIIHCSFDKNEGKGGAVRVTDDFCITPESLKNQF